MWLNLVTFVTSLGAPYPATMDKVDYEAKLATELSKLQEFRASLEQEMRQTISQANDGEPMLDPNVIAQKTQQRFLKTADSAVDAVIDVLENGDKDAVRLSAAKYVLENVKGRTPEGESDPWDKLLERITMEEQSGSEVTEP